MHISELPKEKFHGFEVFFSYVSSAYYDLRQRSSENVFSLELVRTPCAPTRKEFSDQLFAPHWDDPKAYGLWDGKELRAILEVTPEKWNNALILETQSCNAAAIAFYLSQGLSLMGLNTCEYSNQDVERHEIRLEMGCLL